MEHRHAILDEQRVIWVWQIFWSGVFQKVVQNGGFVGLGEKTIWCSKAGGYRHQTVLHEFIQVQWFILTLRLDEEQECKVTLFLILDKLE